MVLLDPLSIGVYIFMRSLGYSIDLHINITWAQRYEDVWKAV